MPVVADGITQQISGANLANFFGGGGGNASTGNVTFSDQVIQGTGTQDGGGGLYLAPGTASTGNLQYLRVRGGDYVTHIHMDTGNNAYYDQYFGADTKYVKLEANGNVVINADDGANSATWTFGTDGNLTISGVIVGTGNLRLQPDPANTGSYLDIFLTSGPDLHLVASAGANLILGKDDGPNVMTSWDGNVYVQSWNTGSNTQGGVWNFGEDGLLTLPSGNVVIGSLLGADAILATNTPFGVVSQGNGSAVMQWMDDISNTTALSAIYINGPTANIGDIVVTTGEIAGAANVWNFGANSTTTFATGMQVVPISQFYPGAGFDGTVITQTAGNSVQMVATGANAGAAIGWEQTPYDGVNPPTGGTAYIDFNDTANSAVIVTGSYDTTVYSWTFGEDGQLSAPGNITAGNILGVNIVVTTPTALANLTAVAGGRAFVNNANLVAAGNFGQQVGSGGSNTVPVWSDGTNWYIG